MATRSASGVGPQDQVGVHFLGQLLGQGEALRRLRIGGLHGGEGAIDDHLLRHAVEVLHPQLAQDIRDLLVSRAVEGGVHHGEGVRHLGHTGLVVDLGQDVLQECFIGLLPQGRVIRPWSRACW